MPRVTIPLLIVALVAGCASSADTHQGRPQLAVARLVIPATLVIPWWSNVETNLLHDQLIEALVRTDTVDVVERTRFDKVMAEQELTKSGITDPDQAARLGKVVGARYVLIGTLDQALLERSSKPLPYTERADIKGRGQIRIAFRVVDVETSRVALASSEDVTEERRMISGSEREEDLKPLWNGLVHKAAAEIAQCVVEHLVTVKVVTLEGNEVELSRGASTGLRVGNVFEVFDTGQAVKDPGTGRIVDRQGRKVGELEVTAVTAGTATAQVRNHSGELKVGATCRLLPEPEAHPARARTDPLQERW